MYTADLKTLSCAVFLPYMKAVRYTDPVALVYSRLYATATGNVLAYIRPGLRMQIYVFLAENYTYHGDQSVDVPKGQPRL